ncbi:uncharacterized protein BP01DRAFT_359272 [Aspergillus saccharolyticus JOP 1030-1]|uniref:Uncharacterized protein n=1 Tax=Aspergillus saccharolyticus JOP 1030-1 TaxID=1450539 RepID=A0A318ZR65_9EURO|nr:hypothetical protein BP01DRAFT_359272 [Aspergillus saccharolyticus JOP 1030-1]PYH42588.1 hypothetical protein BP01DRAFT_359272 [Aspergillus saccharolyticus JOP 1030-1]
MELSTQTKKQGISTRGETASQVSNPSTSMLGHVRSWCCVPCPVGESMIEEPQHTTILWHSPFTELATGHQLGRKVEMAAFMSILLLTRRDAELRAAFQSLSIAVVHCDCNSSKHVSFYEKSLPKDVRKGHVIRYTAFSAISREPESVTLMRRLAPRKRSIGIVSRRNRRHPTIIP